MMTPEEVETLRDLEQEIIASIGRDLETGSHHLNNVAHTEFAKKMPTLMKTIQALSDWITKQEELFGPSEEADYYEELNRGYAQDRI